jgi:Domain of unknown function (DU1801)
MRRTDASVEGFLASVPRERRREDARRLCAMMQEITREPPALWGTSIIGFGVYHYRHASGTEGDSALASFSPRRQNLVIYLIGEFENRHRSVLARLGPHQTGKGCLYVKRLDDVDHDALRERIDRSLRVRKGVDRASARPLSGPASGFTPVSGFSPVGGFGPASGLGPASGFRGENAAQRAQRGRQAGRADGAEPDQQA